MNWIKKHGHFVGLLMALVKWFEINSSRIILLVGMALIAIAAFLIGIVTGLIVSGIFLIVISLVSERG